MIKGWWIAKVYSIPLLFYVLLVKLALYDIVLYGPLMIAAFTSCEYICVDYALEGKLMLCECVFMMITLCEACLVFYSSYNLCCIVIV